MLCHDARAQSFRRLGAELDAIRPVSVPTTAGYIVAVCEFFHQGLVNADGQNVVVCRRGGKPVPTRVLQVGPGDSCRVAFQLEAGQGDYEIVYGGENLRDPPPPWTAQVGLLLQTRKYVECDLDSFESVRKAFQSSEDIGADYVDSVHHARNPCSPKAEPFLSRYSGVLNVENARTYGFWTSSSDCSFLLIDGRPIVAAPGSHTPEYRALPEKRRDVRLAAGLHRFEYYHATARPKTLMAAFWTPTPSARGVRPEVIPPSAFLNGKIVRVESGPVSLRSRRTVPDFRAKITGEVFLRNVSDPLIEVSFTNITPKLLMSRAKVRWEFGDGLASEEADPRHVYLRPGTYTVKLTVSQGRKKLEVANRLSVHPRPASKKNKPLELKDCLPSLKSYDAGLLDAASLMQLVSAYESISDNKSVVEAVRAGLADGAATDDEKILFKLAKLAGPIARDRLGESKAAGSIWHAAAKRIKAPLVRAECEIDAADVALNDLLDPKTAKLFLDAATPRLEDTTGALASKGQRVWGDYHAATGDGRAARQAYARAEQLLEKRGTFAQRTVWRGAHGRSTEDFIRSGEMVRAIGQIRRWQGEFPAEKIDGYLTLLYAKYWAGRKRYAEAIAQAEQVRAVNADSPYADQLLWLAVDCELKLKREDRAIATLHSLLNDYPGSPLVPKAKKLLDRLE